MRDLEQVCLKLDEVEAIRLADLQGLSHEQVGEKMGVSRATVGRILENARRKVADAITSGKAIMIEEEGRDPLTIGDDMPGQDRTGPRGKGPLTGRGMGRCAAPAPKADQETQTSETQSSETRRGPGGRGAGGMGRGRGRGRGNS